MVETLANDNVGDVRGVAKRVAIEGLLQSAFLPSGAAGLALMPTPALKVRRALS
jgi:hypothetical protein